MHPARLLFVSKQGISGGRPLNIHQIPVRCSTSERGLQTRGLDRLPWFAVGKELSAQRRLVLTFCSFVLPLLMWCVVSYTPFIWHPDIKLQISASREDVTTVFTAGDHLSKEYFPTFVEAIQQENATLREARESGKTVKSGFRARRANVKIMRQISAPAVANGWLIAKRSRVGRSTLPSLEGSRGRDDRGPGSKIQ